MPKYRNPINLVIIGFFLLFFALGINSKIMLHPETFILGSWKEDFWQYGKTKEYAQPDTVNRIFLEEFIREKISKHLVIHQSEEWIFKENSVLLIRKNNTDDVTAKWILKGRGHILKIMYKDNPPELYRIKEISGNELVLHYENSIHINGTVKIYLKRN